MIGEFEVSQAIYLFLCIRVCYPSTARPLVT